MRLATFVLSPLRSTATTSAFIGWTGQSMLFNAGVARQQYRTPCHWL